MVKPPPPTTPTPTPPAPRRGRRRVLRIGLALLICCALLSILLRNRAAAFLIPALLGPALGLDVTLDEVRIGLHGTIAITGLRGESPAPWTTVRRFSAAELTLRVAPWKLLREGVEGISSVRLSRGILDLDLARAGAADDQAPGPEAEERAPILPGALPALDLDFASITVRTSDLEAAFHNLTVASHPNAGASPFTVAGVARLRRARYDEQARVVCEGIYRGGTVRELSVRADDAPFVNAGRLRLDEPAGAFELSLCGGAVAGEGRLCPAGELQLTARADGLDAARLKTLLDRLGLIELPAPVARLLEGRLDLEASLRLPLAAPEEASGNITAALGGARVAGAAFSRVRLSASYDRGVLEVPSLLAEGPSLEIRGTGLRASLAEPTTAGILRSAAGAFALAASDLAAAGAALFPELPLPAPSRGAALTALVRFAAGAAAAEHLRIEGPDLLLDVSRARAALDAEAPERSLLDVEGRLSAGDLSLLENLISTRLSGAATAAFALRGPACAPRADLHIAAANLAVAGAAIAGLDAVLEAERGCIRVHAFQVETGAPADARAALSGTFQLDPPRWEDMHFECRGEDLQALASLAGLAAPPAPADEGTAAAPPLLPPGSFSFTATLAGPLEWPDGEAALRLEGPSPARVLVTKRGDACAAAVHALRLRDVVFHAEAEGTLDRSLRSGSLRLDRLEALSSTTRWAAPHPAAARFDANAGEFTVDPPLIIESDEGRVELRVVPRAGRIEAHLLAHAAAELELAGFVVRAPRLSVEAACGAGKLRDLAASARFEAAAVAAPPAFGVRAHGPLRIACTLDAAASPPACDIEIEAPQILFPGLADGPAFKKPPAGSAAAAIAWRGTRLQLDRGALALGEATPAAAGWVDVDADPAAIVARLGAPRVTRYALELDARGDLSALRELLPDVRALQGAVRINARLSGPADAPELTAALALEDGEAHFSGLPRLDAVSGRLVMTGDRIAIEKLGGDLGGAPFILAGQATGLPGAPRIELAAAAENVLLARTDNVRIRADADLRLRAEGELLAATGAVTITDGRVLRDVPLVDALRNLARRAGTVLTRAPSAAPSKTADRATAGLALFSLDHSPFDDLRFDIRILSRSPIVLRSNLLRGACRPDLTLRGTGKFPVLEGSLYLDGVTVFLPAAKFLASSGVVHFDAHKPLFPEIDITAAARMRGYDITAVISGPVNNLLIEFSSSPPLPSESLLLMVTTGRPPGAEDVESEKQVLITAAQYFGLDLLRSLFGRERIDAGESILERFEFDIGRNLSRSGNETWEARFLVTRALLSEADDLYLTGERDGFDHYNAGVRVVFRND